MLRKSFHFYNNKKNKIFQNKFNQRAASLQNGKFQHTVGVKDDQINEICPYYYGRNIIINSGQLDIKMKLIQFPSKLQILL